MDAGTAAIIGAAAAIVGAVIGAIAGIGGALVQARSARVAAQEADDRKRDVEVSDRIRAFRLRAIEEAREGLARELDFDELRASGRTEEAAALDKHSWAPREKPGIRVMNLSLLGDRKLLDVYLDQRRDLESRMGGTLADVPRIQNMRVLVMGLLAVQERAALADEATFSVDPPATPNP